MSDTPIFDRLAAARGYDKMVEPNGKTSSGVGFFARVVNSRTGEVYAPDPDLDGPIELVGAQQAEEVPVSYTDVLKAAVDGFGGSRLIPEDDFLPSEEEAEEIYIFPSPAHFSSLVKSGFVAEQMDQPTHEIPRIQAFDPVLKAEEATGGDLRPLNPYGVQMDTDEAQDAQKAVQELYDSVRADTQSGKAEAISEAGRPEEKVLAEREIDNEDLYGISWDQVLDGIRAEAKEKFPYHIVTTIETMEGNPLFSTTKIRAKGVEGALPIYKPLFEGDVREE